MSCLYSSPELKPPNRHCVRNRRAPGACISRARNPDAVPIHADFFNRRLQQRRVPHRRRHRRRTFVQPVNTSPAFLRRSSSAISGFRSICGRKRRSSHSHRARFDPRFGTFHPARLAGKTLKFARFVSGLHRCCGRNVVGPSEYSKRFLRSNHLLSRHFSARDRPRDTAQVGFRPPGQS